MCILLTIMVGEDSIPLSKTYKVKKFCLIIVALLLCAGFDSYAQLTAEAGNDTIVCNPASYPRLGGAPTAIAGTPPYNYNWEYVPDPTNTFFYIDIVTAANPKVRGVPLSGDTMTFRVIVSDAMGNTAFDIVKVKIARWNCAGGACVKNIVQGDTVALGTGCTGNYSPNTILWSPATNLSSTTSSNPLTWTPTTTSYYAKTSNAIGCWRDDTCKVNVTPLGFSNIEKTKGQVMVYPNPVNETTIFAVSSDMVGGILQVYSMDGRMVLRQEIIQVKTEIGKALKVKSAVYTYNYESPGNKTMYGKWVSE